MAGILDTVDQRTQLVGENRLEILMFRLAGRQLFAINVFKVQEVLQLPKLTLMPQRHPFVCGVVNLRGLIVPIVALRLKLACEGAEYTDFTVVIVLNVRGRVMAVVVDSVSDVLALGADSIKPAPEMNASVNSGYIMGMGCVKSGDVERLLILTDIDALMSSAEMGLMDATLH